MSEKTPNDSLATGVGQDQAKHEAIENYDAAHGSYQEPAGQLAPPSARPTTADPKPFGTLKKG